MRSWLAKSSWRSKLIKRKSKLKRQKTAYWRELWCAGLYWSANGWLMASLSLVKVDEQAKVPVNTVIAYILEEGEELASFKVPEKITVVAVQPKEDSQNVLLPPVVSTNMPSRMDRAHVVSPAVSHLLRRFDIEKKFDKIKGSGPMACVLKGDVLAYINEHRLSPKPVIHPEPSSSFSRKPIEVISTVDITRSEDIQEFGKRLLTAICNAAKEKDIQGLISVEADRDISHPVQAAVNELKTQLKLPVQFKISGETITPQLSVHISAPTVQPVPTPTLTLKSRNDALSFFDYLGHRAPLPSSCNTPLSTTAECNSNARIAADLYDVLGNIPQKGDPRYHNVVSVRLTGLADVEAAALQAISQSFVAM